MMLIGRIYERSVMETMLDGNQAELLAVVGRRRIGKTFLIREVYKKQLVFEFVGIQNATNKEHLMAFLYQIKDTFPDTQFTSPFKNWIEAFHALTKELSQLKSQEKPVVFFDEFPWISSRKSDFLKAFSYFWNAWASKKTIVVAVCGSSTSWMVDHLINNKGGLHNRITRTIYLSPFDCLETKEFLLKKGLKFTDEQITEIYMAMGGVPFYLNLIPQGSSVSQSLQEVFFTSQSPLKNEFQNLYASLFLHFETHVSIIKACFSKWKGLTHSEIVATAGLKSGGTASKCIKELENAGFLTAIQPFGNQKKDTLFRLSDEFSIFYLQFIDKKKNTDFQSISQTQSYKIWKGFAFENFCFKHIKRIKEILGISGILVNTSSFMAKSTEQKGGFQIDLLLDRKDDCINLCEIKYYDTPFKITKKIGEEWLSKIENFRVQAKTKKTIFFTLISKSGVQVNDFQGFLIDKSIVLKDFFGR